MKTFLSLSLLLIGVGFSMSGCDSGNAQSPATLEPALAVDSNPQIIIEHMAYVPTSLAVAKGTTVTWKDNQAIMPHTVTSDKEGGFDSGNLHKGDSWSYTFKESGTYAYHCTHHKKMHGTIIVQ